ncbi:MAG TPA: hypothetical protein VHK47_05420 [Polyangia bacterium]|nr:hypothetical protein [Polyangia bacterium]
MRADRVEGGAFELQTVSADGATVVGVFGGAGRLDVFRWTPTSGLEISDLPAGRPADTSADGRVVAGTSPDGHAFRWTREEGARDLGALPGHVRSVAAATSADGGTVVGLSAATDDATPAWRIFKWTPAIGLVPLQYPDGAASCETRAGLTTADGDVTFGRCGPADAPRSGLFRWATGCVYLLASFSDGRQVDPRLATADGRVLAGALEEPGGAPSAFRWTEETGVVLAPGGGFQALAMSRDGRVLVGQRGDLPARWTEGEASIVALPLPPGHARGAVRSISDDGGVGAGEVSASAGSPPAAAIWDGTTGVRLVADLLRARGIDLAGATLTSARISPDGGTLVGTATVHTANDALWTAPLRP